MSGDEKVTVAILEVLLDEIRANAAERGLSAYVAEALRFKRDRDRLILDEYLADYERRQGPISEHEQERARRVFDEVFAGEGQWPAAS